MFEAVGFTLNVPGLCVPAVRSGARAEGSGRSGFVAGRAAASPPAAAARGGGLRSPRGSGFSLCSPVRCGRGCVRAEVQRGRGLSCQVRLRERRRARLEGVRADGGALAPSAQRRGRLQAPSSGGRALAPASCECSPPPPVHPSCAGGWFTNVARPRLTCRRRSSPALPGPAPAPDGGGGARRPPRPGDAAPARRAAAQALPRRIGPALAAGPRGRPSGGGCGGRRRRRARRRRWWQ